MSAKKEEEDDEKKYSEIEKMKIKIESVRSSQREKYEKIIINSRDLNLCFAFNQFFRHIFHFVDRLHYSVTERAIKYR